MELFYFLLVYVSQSLSHTERKKERENMNGVKNLSME